jgi:hypothetical protein
MPFSFNAGDRRTVPASINTQAPTSKMRLTVAYAHSSDIYVVMIDQSALLTTVIADCLRKYQITNVRKQYVLEVEVCSQKAKVTSVNDLREGDKLHLVESSRDGDPFCEISTRSARDRTLKSKLDNEKRKCSDLIDDDDDDDDDSDVELLSIQSHAKRNRPNYTECESDEEDDSEEESSEEESDDDSDSDHDEDGDSDDEEDEWNATHMPPVYTRIRPGANNRHTIGRKVDSYDRRFFTFTHFDLAARWLCRVLRDCSVCRQRRLQYQGEASFILACQNGLEVCAQKLIDQGGS